MRLALPPVDADRPGLRNTDLVQKIHRKLDNLLQKSVNANHPENAGLFAELKKKIPDLRTLNTLHSEKLLAFKMEPRLGTQVASSTGDGAIVSALLPDRWTDSDWSDSPKEASYGSPRSVCSVMSADESATSVKSPPRCASASSAKSSADAGAQSEPLRPAKRPHASGAKSVSSSSVLPHLENGCSSGDESYFSESPLKGCANGANGGGNAYAKLRRVDSPTDSGIESGKEHCSGSTPTTSVCSSPRSALEEKVKDVSDSECNEKQETIDDMPMLKRALQAPPLINSNMLMDEAYRHHKKFRASKREGSSPSPSTTTPSDSLASTHSTLVKTLEQAPRYLSEQQLKRTDLIHNIIMRSESLPTSTAERQLQYQQHLQQQQQAPQHQQQQQQPQAKQPSVLVSPGYYIPASCPYSKAAGVQSEGGLAPRRSPLPSLVPSPKPLLAIKLSQSRDVVVQDVDSQPLNLSKRAPSSPTVAGVKLES